MKTLIAPHICGKQNSKSGIEMIVTEIKMCLNDWTRMPVSERLFVIVNVV